VIYKKKDFTTQDTVFKWCCTSLWQKFTN